MSESSGEIWNLLSLCFVMFCITFALGWIPMIFRCSSSKLEYITIIGCGFLLGTAMMIIIPEGISVLMETNGIINLDTNNIETNNDIINVPQNHHSNIGEIDLNDPRLIKNPKKHRRMHEQHIHEHSHSHSNMNKNNDKTNEHHDHHHNPLIHKIFKQMGIWVCIGFIFMMVIEKLSNGHDIHDHSRHNTHHHRHNKHETIRLINTDNKTIKDSSNENINPTTHKSNNNISFLIGLITHAAIDGIALGAVSAESSNNNNINNNSSNEHSNSLSLSLFISLALMVHKGPAAISMVAFLKRTGQTRNNIVKSLFIFSISSPIMSILTYFILDILFLKIMGWELANSEGLGCCLLFSGGTFIYVVTLHILPEIKQWRSNNKQNINNNSNNDISNNDIHHHNHSQLLWKDLILLSFGVIGPFFFEHSH